MAKPWMDKEDKDWLRDFHAEVEQEVRGKPDPATKRNTCRCGHSLAKHYMGTMAMPCGQCSCMRCECQNAEALRHDRARKGVQDMTPLSRVFRGGR